jgi:hypothetical protein
MFRFMAEVFRLIVGAILDLFRSRASLEAEIVALRQQLNVLRRKSAKRPAFSTFDRAFFAGLYRIAPGIKDALAIVRPETVIRWHRAGFRLFWRWKSRPRSGRPKVTLEVRQLIRDMSLANPLWGAPRIHGELLKLGIDIGRQIYDEAPQASVPRLEDILAQPRRRNCFHGPVRGPDLVLQAIVRPPDFAPWQTSAFVVRRDAASNVRVAGAAAH